MEERGQTRHLWQIATPYAIFAVALIALVVRSFYGFCWIDESFYVSLADRLSDGGIPIYDEWHPAQLYAPMLLIVYSVYTIVMGSTDGIILFFRLVYVLFSFFVALAAYRVFQKSFGRFISCCISLLYLFYVRANILGLSYYSLCSSFFLLGLVLAWCTYHRASFTVDDGSAYASRVLQPFGAGVCFGLATICNPYVAVILVIACVAGLAVLGYYNHLKGYIHFLWGIIGALMAAAFYLAFLFYHIPPDEVIAGLSNVMSSHDENLTMAQRIPNYLSYLSVSRIGFIGTWALVIFLIIWRVLGHDVTTRLRAFVLVVDVICLAAALFVGFNTTYPHRIFLAFVEFAMPCYLLNRDLWIGKHPELLLFWAPGILLSLAWQFASNTQVSGMLIGFSFTCMGAFITVADAFSIDPVPKDDHSTRIERVMKALTQVLIIVIVALTAFIRLASVYSDCPFSEMDTTIETGPAAGLMTSAQHAADYKGVEELVQHIDSDGGVWIEPMAPWAYLECKGSCAVPSTWNIFMNQEDADLYYSQPGHEYPQWILVTTDDLGDPVNVIAGRVKDFPALDMYHDYNAGLRDWLAASGEYGVVAHNDAGVLWKRAEKIGTITEAGK